MLCTMLANISDTIDFVQNFKTPKVDTWPKIFLRFAQLRLYSIVVDFHSNDVGEGFFIRNRTVNIISQRTVTEAKPCH
jgi:hypothetical protein